MVGDSRVGAAGWNRTARTSNQRKVRAFYLSIQTEDVMKSTRQFITIVAIGLGFIMPLNMAFADSDSLNTLSAEWWQWALSIPTSKNPQLDTSGENCMVGQRGSIWFLAGVFGGGTTTRTCSVPADKIIFFPVINSVNINTPNICGQGPDNISVEDLRALSAPLIDGATNLLVEVDGKSINVLRPIQSQVFEVALPEDNVFDAPCTGAALGNVPAGIYSPSVDEGFYVKLNPLKKGNHTLHFHAENPSQSFVEDVRYNLTIVPVLSQ